MAQLSDIQIGPVLRGLSAVTAARSVDAASLRPGARFRFIAAGDHAPGGHEPEGAAPSDGSRSETGPQHVAAPQNVDESKTVGAQQNVAETPLVLPSIVGVDDVARAWASYTEEHDGVAPAVITLPSGAQWVRTASGPAPRSDDRSGLLTTDEIAGSIEGRVVIVTGAAQGFGLQIARGLASLGAIVAFADMNVSGAEAQAAALGAPHRAFAVNVTDEESVRTLLDAVTATYGGVDLLVSNAGVLKAGSVKELSLKDFRFVTDVNYVGFFLMTKHTAPVMELQYRGAIAAQTGVSRPLQYLTDIVEINSKSGLSGSNKNAAYAGSKFGGIGLVQSFAMELVEQGTKVNAICPGNYLDGPLWSDPERGLFVQYLQAGKVPGATTIDDVRRFYEDKVPMKRGCTGADVVRGVAYVVGQPYETGQALPITGGQVMLR